MPPPVPMTTLMTDIVARMRVAIANREYDKMPALKQEQDAAMGRFAAC